MSKKRIFVRLLAGFMAVILTVTSSIAVETPVASYASQPSGNVTYTGDPADVIDNLNGDLADPAGDLPGDTDDAVIDEGSDDPEDVTPAVDPDDKKADDTDDADQVGEASDVSGSDTEDEADTDVSGSDAEDRETDAADESEDSLSFEDTLINIYSIADEDDTLTGIFALTGSEEYTWDYSDSADKVFIKKSEENPAVLDIYTAFGYSYESLLINDKEFEAPELDFIEFVKSVKYVNGEPFYVFSVELTDEDLETLDAEDPTLSVGVRLRPIAEDESFLSIFKWSTDPSDKDKDYYIKDAYISLNSIALPAELGDDSVYELAKENKDSALDLPDYISYINSDGEYNVGTLIMPKGSTLGLKLLPKHGYQVKNFGITEESVIAESEDTNAIGTETVSADTDAYSDDAVTGKYTIKADTTLFNPAPEFIKADNEVITDGAEEVLSGEISIDTDAEETDTAFPGTVRLEVIDVPEDGEGALSDEQIDSFNEATEGEIVSFLDISLYNVIYKAEGTPAESANISGFKPDTTATLEEPEPETWETELKNPQAPVTVTLNLDPDMEIAGLKVLHQKEIINGDVIEYEYEIVPSEINDEDHTITFEAESFSVYALSISTPYYVYIECVNSDGTVIDSYETNSIENAIAFITDKDHFNSTKGEYRMFLGQENISLDKSITLPSCVTRFVIVASHEKISSNKYKTKIFLNCPSFKSNAPVVIDGAIILDGNGEFIAPSLEITRLSAFAAYNLKVTGTTTLNGGSYLFINNNATLNTVKVLEDFERNDLDEIDTDYPLYKPSIFRYNEATLSINGVITADNETTGLRMGITRSKVTITSALNERDTSYHYNGTKNHSFTMADMYKMSISSLMQDDTNLVFNTTQKSIPGFIYAEDFGGKNTAVYLVAAKKKVYAGEPKYELGTYNWDEGMSDYVFVKKGQYVKWDQVKTAVAALNNPEDTYKVSMLDDADSVGLPMPKNAKQIIFASGKLNSLGHIVMTALKYTSSTKLTCDTALENVWMTVTDAKGTELSPYTVATLDIAGRRLDLSGDKVFFNSPVTFNDSAKKGTFHINYGTKVVTANVTPDQTVLYSCTTYTINGLSYAAQDSSSTRYLLDDDRANQFYLSNSEVSVIAGSITNVGNVIISDETILVMADYQTKKDTWASPVFSATRLDNYGQLWMVEENNPNPNPPKKTKATITNVYMYGLASSTIYDINELKADSVNITNLYLMEKAWVESRGAFDVGNLYSFSSEATLATRQNAANKSAPNTPFLNVTGTVLLQDPSYRVNVFVKESTGAVAKLKQQFGEKKPSGSMVLLTTKNGTIDQFVPYHDIDTAGEGPSNIPSSCYYWEGGICLTGVDDAAFNGYSGKNTKGYFLKKTGSTIHLYEGSDVAVAVIKGAHYKPNGSTKSALAYAADAGVSANYYSSWADAVAAVNAAKSKDSYQFIIVNHIGNATDPDNKPIALTFPAAANISELYVTGNLISPLGYIELLYTNALTLTSDTTFECLAMAPVAYYKKGTKVKFPTIDGTTTPISVLYDSYVNTTQPINTGAYNLTIEAAQAVVTGALNLNSSDTYLVKFVSDGITYVPWIGNITGNGQKVLELKPYLTGYSPNYHYPIINGSISKFATFAGSYDEVWVAGDINVTNISANNILHVLGKNLKANQVFANVITASSANVVISGELKLSSASASSVFGSLTADNVDVAYSLGVNNKSNIKNLILYSNATFGYRGDTVISDTVEMNGNSTLSGEWGNGSLTIKNIVSNGSNNSISYKSNSKKLTSLSITGTVSGTDAIGIIYYPAVTESEMMPVETQIPYTATSSTGTKLTIPAVGNIANVGLNSVDKFIVYVNGTDMSSSSSTNYLVKYNKGLYMVSKSSSVQLLNSIIKLERTDIAGHHVSYYPDFTQAITEINNINDKNADYTITLCSCGTFYDFEDSNIFDANPYGSLILPGKDKMNSLTIQSKDSSYQATLNYYGAVNGYNKIVLKSIRLNNITGAKNFNPAFGKVSFVSLELDSSQINCGALTSTDIELCNGSNVWAKGEVRITDSFNVSGSVFTFDAKTTIKKLNLEDSYAVFKSTTEITDLITNDPISISPGTDVNNQIYAACKTINGPSLLTVKGEVDGIAFIKLFVPINKELKELSTTDGYTSTSYAGRQLAMAPAANAASFRAYGLSVDSAGKYKSNSYVSYKDGSKYVVNDDVANMLIEVFDKDDSNTFTYAHTWNEAVAAINNANNGHEYWIIFLKSGKWRANAVVNKAAMTDPKTQVCGDYDYPYDSDDGSMAGYKTTDVAALTMPKATAASRIIIQTNDSSVTLVYKGAFAPQTDITIDANIALTNTSVQKSGGKNLYKPGDSDDHMITAITIANGKTLAYSENNVYKHYFSNITGAKGTIVMPVKESYVTGNINVGELNLQSSTKDVEVAGKITATSANLYNGSKLRSYGDVSITNLYMQKNSKLWIMTGTGKTTGKLSLGTVMIDSGATGSNQAEICAADNTATITNIDATSGTPELKLLYYFTTPSAKAAGVSLLSINGTINKVKVHLWPNIRQYNTMYNQYSTYPNGSPLYEVIPITKLSDIFNVLSDTKPEYAEYKGKTICGTTKTWNSEMGWYNRKLLTLPKAGIDNIDVYNNTTLWEYKSGQAMYLAEDMPGIQVMGFANEAFSSKTYDGSFFDLAEAVAEINRIGSKKEGEANSIVVILFKENIGTSTSPVALTLPTSIRALELQSDSLYGQIIYTTTTTLNASYDLGLYSLEIIPRAKGPGSKVYNVNTQMSINTGKNKLRLSNFYSETHIKDITCGTLDSPDINLGVTGKINVSEDFNLGQGLAANTVNVGKKMNVTCGSSRTVNISGALTVGDLTVSNSSLINVGTMLTANNLTLRNSTTVNAANITVKATTELGESSILRAGRAFVGDNAKTVKDKATDGKITLKDVEFKGGTGSSATISVKNAPLDKNGRTSGSQLTVTGNVTCGYSLDPSTFVENNKEPIQVEIRENTEGGSETAFTNVVCPSGGMLLVTAPNASDWFFRPSTSMMNLLYSTHYLKLYGKIIKSGKNIIFDRVNARFRLHVLATSLLSTSPKAKTAIDTDGNGIINMEDGYQYDYKCYIDFETYEDAVNQINTLNRFKMIDDDGDYIPDRVSQYYEDYFIEYIDSAYDTYDIKNAAGAYVALPLPAKAGEVNLYSGTGSKLEMRFLGAITLKSHLTIADGVSLVPVVKASGVYEDTYSAINLGTYRLRLFNDYTKYHVSDAVDYAPISPSSITGSTNSRLVITTQNNGKLAFICTGNISVPYLEIDLNGNSADAEFTVFGNLTVTKLSLISAQSACAYVGCGQNVTFTDIEVQGHICPRFEIYKSKLIKLNGQVTGYHSEKMIVYMEDAKDIGTVYVTGPKINAADWQLLDCTETCRNSYKVGNNLMLGYN